MTHATAFTPEGLQFIWNSSSLKPLEECLYKYKLQILDGWQSPERNPHIIFGGHYAKALEHFYLYVAQGQTPDEALLAVVKEIMLATWFHDKDEDGAIIPGTGKPWTSTDNLKTREHLIRSIVWYVDHFADDIITVKYDAEGKPLVEFEGVVPIDDGLMFSAHLDRVVEYNADPYIMDQKTTKSTITPYYFQGFNPDVQMSLYTFMGRAVFDMPIKGIIIDVAQIAVGFTRFERGFTMRTESQLNEWYDTTLYHIGTAHAATRADFFPQNRTACGNYGGCPFRSACSRPPEVREQFLKASFVKRGRVEPLEPR